MSQKERLDILLADKGLFPSREKAKAAIMAGLVLVDGERVDKAGTKVKVDSRIEIKGDLHPYVSRGGLKLEKALHTFNVNLDGKVVIDIGASTGGFTDCSLQHGARLVYSVDVGYGQLAWELRQDPRVIVMERTNFRHLKPEDLKGDRPEIAVMDVSFISIRLLLPVLKQVLVPGGGLISLIKPQFEAGREKVGRNGIVREPQIHREVLQTVLHAALSEGFQVMGLTYSPITGGDGNIEFLTYLTLTDMEGTPEPPLEDLVRHTVREAHQMLQTVTRSDK
ncbi:TlyA family RNA methyltransferase [Effusibacillus lacus]|uniref:TlyA family rRNA (Cytidine-2'-O)-methyltransferase n=1 Tax=Effusibacillus lacus TaxID=1348429 RepID=A0A292YPT6_9BACL|nr:TlyA family RNA methyltransferase [Effusibacillus lacus]TCS72514.1 23S rRNA (cytidine1920-2'-O)/16S rRNA (cytidine1409-2'-O)-methyltransferase [Effusibacillus lacus]GAX90921.1 TlyA family rRNA (cytidine-2'-O)-methyltransferase [Effusibacillus lacus]